MEKIWVLLRSQRWLCFHCKFQGLFWSIRHKLVYVYLANIIVIITIIIIIPVNMPQCAFTGPELGWCYRHRPGSGPFKACLQRSSSSLSSSPSSSSSSSSSSLLLHHDHHHHQHNHIHHNHHHHHYCSIYLRNDQKIWITTKIHIFTKGFKRIECGCFLRDHAGFHEHNKPRVALYKL